MAKFAKFDDIPQAGEEKPPPADVERSIPDEVFPVPAGEHGYTVAAGRIFPVIAQSGLWFMRAGKIHEIETDRDGARSRPWKRKGQCRCWRGLQENTGNGLPGLKRKTTRVTGAHARCQPGAWTYCSTRMPPGNTCRKSGSLCPAPCWLRSMVGAARCWSGAFTNTAAERMSQGAVSRPLCLRQLPSRRCWAFMPTLHSAPHPTSLAPLPSCSVRP